MAAGAAQSTYLVDGFNRCVDRVDHEAGDAVHHDFGHGAMREGDDGRAASHGFDHDQPKGFGPGNGKEQRVGVAQEAIFAALVDLAQEFD